MKHSILALCCIALASVALLPAHGQVVPSAKTGSVSLRAGGFGSGFQPDYAGNGIAQTGPDRLYGFGAYADARFTRWIQPELEMRWLHFNQFQGVDENTYSIGERLPIINYFHGFTPYGKLLIGIGNGSFLTGNAFVVTYGGGVDYRLTRKFTLRAVDFEYQQWHVNPTLWPYGISVGLSYKVF